MYATSFSSLLPHTDLNPNFARSYAQRTPLTSVSCHSLQEDRPSSQALAILSSNKTSKRTSLLGRSNVCGPVQKRNGVGKAFCAMGLGVYGENVIEHQSHSHATEDKVGVLLLNLGGPDTLNDVQPFLFNLFADPDIIRLPRLFQCLQWPLAKLISVLRAPKSKEGYASIGGGSPLRKITNEQMAHRLDDFKAQQYVNEWSTSDQMEEMGMGLGSNPPSFPTGTNVLNNPLVGGSSGQQQTSESSVIPHCKRAKWWRWFSIEERNINGKITTKTVCKFYKATLLNDSSCGVSHIKRHGEKCAKDHAPKDRHQTTLTQNEDGQISTFRYNQKAMRTGLAQYIESTEIPFTVAECKYFAKFITKYVQSQYVPITRNTARHDITNLFDQLRLALIHRFDMFKGVISVTSYCWTGCNKLGYICVTSHFIDENWMLRKG